MKYRGASQLMLGGMAMVLLAAPGCSNMKWFQSGSDDQSMSQEGRSGSEYAKRDGARDGQYPSLGREGRMTEAEGGKLARLLPAGERPDCRGGTIKPEPDRQYVDVE
jgi:peptidoglycan-associated lipoprotein